MDDVKLPRYVQLKIDTEEIDEETKEMLKCFYVTDKKKLPFKLNRLIPWPSKERAITDRALIFLKTGYWTLIDESESMEVTQKKVDIDNIKVEKAVDSDFYNPPKPRFSL